MSDETVPATAGGPDAAVAGTAVDAAPAEVAAGSTGGGEMLHAAEPSHRSYFQVTFTGLAADYFRIWIVNLLLTLLTLGVWSAWAKVRKHRYLYGHTWLAGANFEYHANPIAILRGRLIAAAAIGVYWLFENLLPSTGPWLLAALLCGAPWIIARSLTFNAANSSHRGIRFGFSGTQRDVALAIWPLALALVAFVAIGRNALEIMEHPGRYFARMGTVTAAFIAIYPYAIAQIRRLTVGKTAWGNQPFSTTMRVRNVYGIYAIGAALCCIPLLVAIVVLSFAAFGTVALTRNHPSWAIMISGMFGLLGWASVLIVWTAYNRSRMTNLVVNTARLSNIARLRGAISARALAKLYTVNLLAIIASCGLLIPWAVVRLARYRLQAITVEIEAPLTAVTAAVVQNPRATGEELGEMFGFDLAL